MDRITSFREPGSRYATLRVVVFLCNLTGAILLVIGGGLLISGLYGLATGAGSTAPAPNPAAFPGPPVMTNPPPLPAWFFLIWSLAILFSGMQLIALGAFLPLMIHLEENTRASAQALDKIRSRLESSPDGVEPLFRS
jgi:hypothetical protein